MHRLPISTTSPELITNGKLTPPPLSHPHPSLLNSATATASELGNYDARELGYDRIALSLDQIEFLGDAQVRSTAKKQILGNDAVVWCYVGRRESSADASSSSLPNDSFPVIQSYLDVILHGCHDVGGDNFVKSFLETTEGWGEESGSFLDDRAEPAYVRASAVAARSAILNDRALKAVRPDELDNRVPCPTIVGRYVTNWY